MDDDREWASNSASTEYVPQEQCSVTQGSPISVSGSDTIMGRRREKAERRADTDLVQSVLLVPHAGQAQF